MGDPCDPDGSLRFRLLAQVLTMCMSGRRVKGARRQYARIMRLLASPPRSFVFRSKETPEVGSLNFTAETNVSVCMDSMQTHYGHTDWRGRPLDGLDLGVSHFLQESRQGIYVVYRPDIWAASTILWPEVLGICKYERPSAREPMWSALNLQPKGRSKSCQTPVDSEKAFRNEERRGRIHSPLTSYPHQLYLPSLHPS